MTKIVRMPSSSSPKRIMDIERPLRDALRLGNALSE